METERALQAKKSLGDDLGAEQISTRGCEQQSNSENSGVETLTALIDKEDYSSNVVNSSSLSHE